MLKDWFVEDISSRSQRMPKSRKKAKKTTFFSLCFLSNHFTFSGQQYHYNQDAMNFVNVPQDIINQCVQWSTNKPIIRLATLDVPTKIA